VPSSGAENCAWRRHFLWAICALGDGAVQLLFTRYSGGPWKGKIECMPWPAGVVGLEHSTVLYIRISGIVPDVANTSECFAHPYPSASLLAETCPATTHANRTNKRRSGCFRRIVISSYVQLDHGLMKRNNLCGCLRYTSIAELITFQWLYEREAQGTHRSVARTGLVATYPTCRDKDTVRWVSPRF